MIRFSITLIRNHSIVVIKDNSYLIIFYFIQQLRHSSKLKKTFWNFPNLDGIVSNDVPLYKTFRVCSLSSSSLEKIYWPKCTFPKIKQVSPLPQFQCCFLRDFDVQVIPL